MDPQTCFQNIMEVVEHPENYTNSDHAWEDLDNYMSDLWEWLERGGRSPVVESLGITNQGSRFGTEPTPRDSISTRDQRLIGYCTLFD